MSETATEPAARSRVRWVVAAVVVLAAAVWYLWPELTGGGSNNVAVVADDTTRAVTPHLGFEVRVRGRDLVDLGVVADWCALADTARDVDLGHHTGYLVVALSRRGDCTGDPVRASLVELRGRHVRPIVVLLPGSGFLTADALPSGVRTAPVEALLGRPDQRTMPCAWWDRCFPGGVVTVRSDDGSLTDVGADRVARMAAAVVG